MDAIPRDLPVAILGSTPEFRDLLHESGFREIFVFERNSAFYDAMSRSRVHDNQEMFVQGDWTTTLSQHRGKFAVILSDLTSGNVPYEQRAKFYADLESALLVGGVFCDKVLTHSIPTLAIAPLSEKYERLPLNLVHINHFSSEMLFCSELIDLEQIRRISIEYSNDDFRGHVCRRSCRTQNGLLRLDAFGGTAGNGVNFRRTTVRILLN
jgi:hypothetical protein